MQATVIALSLQNCTDGFRRKNTCIRVAGTRCKCFSLVEIHVVLDIIFYFLNCLCCHLQCKIATGNLEVNVGTPTGALQYHLLAQIVNRPITSQQFNGFKPVDMVEKVDFNDFVCTTIEFIVNGSKKGCHLDNTLLMPGIKGQNGLVGDHSKASITTGYIGT